MEQPPTAIFAHCPDRFGRDVVLSRNVGDHIGRRHPEMTSFLGNVCDVLAEPDLVYHRPEVPSYLFYKLGILQGDWPTPIW